MLQRDGVISNGHDGDLHGTWIHIVDSRLNNILQNASLVGCHHQAPHGSGRLRGGKFVAGDFCPRTNGAVHRTDITRQPRDHTDRAGRNHRGILDFPVKHILVELVSPRSKHLLLDAFETRINHLRTGRRVLALLAADDQNLRCRVSALEVAVFIPVPL